MAGHHGRGTHAHGPRLDARKSLGSSADGGYIETVAPGRLPLAVPVRLVSDIEATAPLLDNAPPIELKDAGGEALCDPHPGRRGPISASALQTPSARRWARCPTDRPGPIDAMENVAGAPDTAEACRTLGVKHLPRAWLLRSAEAARNLGPPDRERAASGASAS